MIARRGYCPTAWRSGAGTTAGTISAVLYSKGVNARCLLLCLINPPHWCQNLRPHICHPRSDAGSDPGVNTRVTGLTETWKQDSLLYLTLLGFSVLLCLWGQCSPAPAIKCGLY